MTFSVEVDFDMSKEVKDTHYGVAVCTNPVNLSEANTYTTAESLTLLKIYKVRRRYKYGGVFSRKVGELMFDGYSIHDFRTGHVLGVIEYSNFEEVFKWIVKAPETKVKFELPKGS